MIAQIGEVTPNDADLLDRIETAYNALTQGQKDFTATKDANGVITLNFTSQKFHK